MQGTGAEACLVDYHSRDQGDKEHSRANKEITLNQKRHVAVAKINKHFKVTTRLHNSTLLLLLQ